MRVLRWLSIVLMLSGALACTESSPATDAGRAQVDRDAGPAYGGDPSWLDEDTQAQWAALKSKVASATETSRKELLEQHAVPFQSLGYDPLSAAHLDLIQASPVKLDDAQRELLGKNGFVILGDREFPTFTYAYQTLYLADLPVYVSADSILDAVHRSYDDMLVAFEHELLVPELTALLERLNAALAKRPDSQTRRDLDLYLTVARALLSGQASPKAGAEQSKVDELVAIAVDAQGTADVKLFGLARSIDASQFKPRGHYEDDEILQRYFRAMIWLGRIDFTLVETIDERGTQRLNRAQVEAMLLLDQVFTAADRASFERIDDVIHTFVGEPDNMTLSQIPALLTALGVSDHDVSAIADDTLMRTILEQSFGKQQILSHLLEGGVNGPVPLSSIFLLFGQRYVVDSHVFSNVVWDRTAAMRMMPDPLDVAFAALGNDQAVSMLDTQLEQYDYAGNLASMRTLVDEHDASFWKANLYNEWLSALRALSPTADIADPAKAGLPAVAATEAWGRRILNTQLASWSQLRHDTLLYAKQSYTSGAVCEFPDAMVDPYPEHYAALERFAAHGTALADLARDANATNLEQRVRTYFTELGTVAGTLRGMAEHQRTGEPFTKTQLAFINDAVVITTESAGCTTVEQAAGWYPRLFFNLERALEQDPIIADVHTQPTDEAGNDLGRILHVATGLPRLMVTTADTCVGPRAYVGPVSSYYEKLTDGWQRTTDSEWSQEVTTQGKKPADVKWMTNLIAP